MRKYAFLLLFFAVLCNKMVAQETVFALYKTSDKEWKPSIWAKYIEEYAGLEVDATLLNTWEIGSIEEEIKYFDVKYTEDIDSAINAVQNGKKVFFFVDKFVWGGLEKGTTYSGSWQRKMPMCSGFYFWNNKSFENEGLNYHCGRKEKNYKIRFYIVNSTNLKE